ncbi:siderophore-interacting protein [Occultella aeris]|uniref:NADPH-dependent ferric-chelate reductase n=2 Tax=Occultella aeris TaxID=2761496 RepID=A0A7M4DQC4_9MICO|nr:NADPH-dependent ferric-chelate reductase [Occultella aeris]
MIRIRLGGPDMADYPTTGIGDEYVRVFFPDTPDEEPRLPFVTERGWDFSEGVEPSAMRTYTIRDHRPGAVDIDFVAHPGGVAADWALAAQVGQAVGINPPRGLYDRPRVARHQVLIADEPALPAALRVAELTAGEVSTHVVAEVRSPEHRLEAAVDGVTYSWLYGSGNGVAPTHLPEVTRRLTLACDGGTYVWVAGESRATREIRTHLRHGLGLPADSYKVVGYWTDRAEEWTQRYESLDAGVRQRIEDLYDGDLDAEQMIDEVHAIYASAGL